MDNYDHAAAMMLCRLVLACGEQMDVWTVGSLLNAAYYLEHGLYPEWRVKAGAA